MNDPLHFRIQGSEKLISIFGDWPSFHDSEVLRLTFDRGSSGTAIELSSFLLADIYVFRMTSEVDERGYYVLKDHTLTQLKFTGLAEVDMGGFNLQNALFGLLIESIKVDQWEELRYAIHFQGTFGVDLTFKCGEIEVLSAIPFHE